MQPSFHIPSPTQSVLDTIAHVRRAIDVDRPSEAELIASEVCAAWYTVAPPLQRSREGMAAHPWGEWPNVCALQGLEADLEAIDDVDACLVLVRALFAMYTEADDVAALVARLENLLVERGAVAPAWSLQFDAWQFQQGHRFVTAKPSGNRPPGDGLIKTMEFVHPCGDRHGVIVHIDPHNFNHIVSIDLIDDYERELTEMRLEIETGQLPLVVETADETSLVFSLSRSIKKTYLHEFEPLRFDLTSIGAFPLLCHRGEALRLPEHRELDS